MKKLIIYLLVLSPIIDDSQNTIKVQKPKSLIKYCGSTGEKTLQFIPKCRSLKIDTNRYEIISFNFEAITNGKLWNYNILSDRISKEIIEMHCSDKKGKIFFTSIKILDKINNETIVTSLCIKWYTR
jgi:hypothetical protein